MSPEGRVPEGLARTGAGGAPSSLRASRASLRHGTGTNDARTTRRARKTIAFRTTGTLLLSLLLLLLVPGAAAADVTVNASAFTTIDQTWGAWGPIWLNAKTGYIVFADSAADVVYTKTTDGGATWSATTLIRADAIEKLAVWFDKWTPGDAGTKIHVAYSVSATDGIFYRNLDTATDTLSTEAIVLDGITVNTIDIRTEIGITKTRGGNLYVGFWYSNNAGSEGFFRSTDGGANWVSKTVMPADTNPEWFRLFPGADADTNDMWAVAWDFAANELELRVYDDSANTWSTTVIATGMTKATGIAWQFSGAVRASDNHLIFAAWSALDDVASDLRVFDIASAASITEKANVITDQDDTAMAAVFIDQQTNDLYVAYVGNSADTWATSLSVHYKKSTDGGATWGAEQTLNEDAAAGNKWIEAGHSVGDAGGHFMPVWFDTTADALFVSRTNDVYIGPKVTLGISGSTLAEAAGARTVTATLAGASDRTVTVNLALTGTATSGTDYNASTTSIAIASGSTTGTSTLTASQDTLDEPAETILVDISSVTNGAESGTQQVTASITDDDLPRVTVTASDATATEAGTTTGEFTVTRTTGDTSGSLTVQYTVTGTATSGTDFTSIGTSTTILAGQASKTVTVTPIDDSDAESDETVILTVASDAGYVVGSPSAATVTIEDNDVTLLTVTASDASASEPGSNTGAFTVTRTGSTASALLFYYNATGTATSGTDYTSIGTSATIDAGQSTKLITVTPLDDSTDEPSETVILTLSDAVAYNPGSPSAATVNVADNDPPDVTVSATDAFASEPGSNTGTFTFTRTTGDTSSALIVYYNVTGTATSGTDFTAIGTSTTIDAGQASKTVTVTPLDDSTDEASETVIATLSDGVQYNLGSPSAATVTIADDDAPDVTVTATDASASEPGSDTGTFTFTRTTGDTSAALVVYYNVTGTATSGSDYTSIGTSTTIDAGQASKTVTVTPLDDATDEASETVIATLSDGVQYNLGSPSAGTVNIADNDPPDVTVAATDASASEPGSDTGTFTFTRTTGDTSAALTVYYNVTGTATSGTDYTSLGTSTTILAGQASKTVTVTPLDDATDEASETVIATLSDGVQYNLGSPATDTVTIADDDAPDVTVTATDSAASETGPDTGTFTITRTTGDTSAALTVYYNVTGTATSGTDYTSIGTSTTILAGQASKTVTVTPVDDAADESSETVILSLSDGVQYNLGSPSAGTVNIADNDAPDVTVTATDASASEPGSNTGTFTFTRTTGDTSAALTVYYNVTGTATSGTDYTSIGTSTTILAGQASKTVTVTPLDDATDEASETVIATLSDGVQYNLGSPSTDTVSIADDDAPDVTVTATDSAASEPGANTGTFTFTRTTGDTSAALTVYYNVTGTATSGTDYTSIGTSTTILAGQASKTVTVTPLDDATDEPSETVIATLSDGVQYNLGSPSTDTVSIADDDAPDVTVTATDASASEAGLGTGTFTFTRTTGDTSAALTVYYNVTGTATSGTDYTSIGTSTTILAGQASKTVTVTPLDDATDEPAETVIVTLSDGVQYNLGSPSTDTVSIADDDAPDVTVTATDASASEPGSNTGTFTFTRTTGDTSSALVVYYNVTGTATSGTDYTSIGTSTTILAGQASKTVTVTPLDDSTDEATETVIVTLSDGVQYNLGSPSAATVNIADDDAPDVTVTATDSAASEPGSNTGTFTFTRTTGDTSAALTVYYNVTGTAASGTDYTSIGTSTTILAGQASKTVTVTPLDDSADEPSETVIVTLSDGVQYNLGSPSAATVNIADDDAPDVTVTASDASASETGPDTGTFTITRTTGDTSSALVVYFNVTGTATSGTDYTSISASATIDAGQASKTITVTPVDDSADEPSETVILTLSDGVQYNLGSPSAATVNIADDDAPSLTVTATDDSASEPGSDAGTFTITRTTGDTSAALTVYFNVTGTATSGADYTSIGTSTTILAGQASKTITVTPLDDGDAEAPETVILTVSDGVQYDLGSPSAATVTINDDDAATVTVMATDSAASEPGSDTGTFTITRTGPTTSAMVVYFNATGTAASGTDYTSIGTSVTIDAGQSSKTVTVTALDDALDEDAETVILTLSDGVQYQLGAPSAATVTISDDDAEPTVTLGLTGSPLAENGGVATVTATLSAVSAKTVTVTLGFTGTATVTTDYTRSGTSIVIGPGSTTGTVTLTGVDDALSEGAETIVVDVTGVTNGVESGTQQVTATITDDEAALTVTLSISGTPMAEAGGVATVTATLSGTSGSDVTVNLAFSGTATVTSDYTRSGESITITAGSTTGSITLTAVQDANDEPAETVIVDISTVVGATESGTQQVTATITDDDLPTVTIAATDASASEPGTDTGTFTVTRTTTDTAGSLTVFFNVTGTATAGTDYTALPASVTILAGATTATLTVTPLDDSSVEGAETVIATLASNAAYTIGSPSSATVTIADNDTPGITVSPTSGLITTESGGTATFTVVLNTVPTADVSIALSSSNTAEGTVSPASLTFTPGNALTAQTVTVTGVDDVVLDGNVAYTIVTAAATSTDGNYAGIDPSDVSVTNNDNDAPGATIAQSGGSTLVTEGGATDTYEVVLNTQPTANVTITVTPDAQVTVSPGTLTFTNATWNVPQTVTVTAVDDAAVEGSHTGTITHAAASTDANYNGVAIASVTATITDNDAANQAPNAVDDSATATAGSPATISVLANDNDPESQTLTITAVSTPSTGSVRISGSNVVYTAPAGFSGTVTFTYTVSDGAGGTDTATVTVTVSLPPGSIVRLEPDPASISQRVGGTSPVTIVVSAFDANDDPVVVDSTADVTWTMSDPAGGSLAANVYTPDGNAGSFTITATLVADPTVSATVSVRIEMPAGGGGGGRSPPAPGPTPGEPGGPTPTEPSAVDLSVFDLTPNLVVEAPFEGGAMLGWTPPSGIQEDVIGFQVWASNSPWRLVANLSVTETSYSDVAAMAGTKYKVTFYTGFDEAHGFIRAADRVDELPPLVRVLPVAAASPAERAPEGDASPAIGIPSWARTSLLIVLVVAVSFGLSYGVAAGRRSAARRAGRAPGGTGKPAGAPPSSGIPGLDQILGPTTGGAGRAPAGWEALPLAQLLELVERGELRPADLARSHARARLPQADVDAVVARWGGLAPEALDALRQRTAERARPGWVRALLGRIRLAGAGRTAFERPETSAPQGDMLLGEGDPAGLAQPAVDDLVSGWRSAHPSPAPSAWRLPAPGQGEPGWLRSLEERFKLVRRELPGRMRAPGAPEPPAAPGLPELSQRDVDDLFARSRRFPRAAAPGPSRAPRPALSQRDVDRLLAARSGELVAEEPESADPNDLMLGDAGETPMDQHGVDRLLGAWREHHAGFSGGAASADELASAVSAAGNGFGDVLIGDRPETHLVQPDVDDVIRAWRHHHVEAQTAAEPPAVLHDLAPSREPATKGSAPGDEDPSRRRPRRRVAKRAVRRKE